MCLTPQRRCLPSLSTLASHSTFCCCSAPTQRAACIVGDTIAVRRQIKLNAAVRLQIKLNAAVCLSVTSCKVTPGAPISFLAQSPQNRRKDVRLQIKLNAAVCLLVTLCKVTPGSPVLFLAQYAVCLLVTSCKVTPGAPISFLAQSPQNRKKEKIKARQKRNTCQPHCLVSCPVPSVSLCCPCADH
uniref:Uncharacterized protein n=1 Tax=Dunaliella tertiolecta TaxID=3047 RepID=A0A7S3QM53_DUNTE